MTIHDLQPLLLPSNFSSVKQAYLRWRLPPSAQRSRLVVTLTEHTKRTIVERLSVAPERVVVVAPGFTLALNEDPEGDPAAAYDLRGPIFVYPAITYPHKNHLTLVRAFAQVVARHPDALLVLTNPAAQMEQAITDEVARLGIAANVRRLGRVPRGDLDWIVRHAVALAFPSRFEGFGLPVLEAMGNGCPVIASAASALPEVVGDSGILVDPDDTDGWAEAMLRLLEDPKARGWYIEAGLARTANYRWAASSAALRRRLPAGARRMNLLVLCPHYAPDLAPTGEVMTSIATELAARGHRLHLVDVAAVVCAPRDRAGVARPHRASRHRPDRAHHPRPSVPHRQAQHPSPGPRLRGVHRAGRPGGAHLAASDPMRCWRCRHRSRSAWPAGRLPALAGHRSSSTSRTCSPTSPSSSA